MRKIRLRFSVLYCFALAASAACVPGQLPAQGEIPLAYTPWTKACRKDPDSGVRTTCFTVSSAKRKDMQVGDLMVSVAVIRQGDGSKPTLRVLVPLGMQLVMGIRITIDKQEPIQQPYVNCYSIGCFSDYVLNEEVLAGLKTGKTLFIQAINSNGSPLTYPIPLADFAGADSGNPNDWVGLERRERSMLESMLAQKAAAERIDLTSELTYSPWTKFCLQGKEAVAKKVCFTGIDGKSPFGTPMVAAVVIEPEGDPKKVLRITIPLNQQLPSGVDLSIDGQSYPNAPYFLCLANGCMVNFAVSDAMFEKLKSGGRLSVQAVNGAGRSFVRSMPLDTFGAANSGPPTEPKFLLKKIQ